MEFIVRDYRTDSCFRLYGRPYLIVSVILLNILTCHRIYFTYCRLYPFIDIQYRTLKLISRQSDNKVSFVWGEGLASTLVVHLRNDS